MPDLIFLVATLAFFIVGIAYTGSCERLRAGKPNGDKLNGGKLNA
jgi:hypothetical protein